MEPIDVTPLIGVALGIGLAAAAGLRVFVPLLAVGLAARGGVIPVSPGFEWIATTPALVALATATVLEVLAFSIPFVDHVLDIVATPAAVAAGIVASAAVLTDVPPWLRWGVAIVAGGSAAGVVQGATVAARAGSTALTGGLANFLFAMLELFGAVGTVLLVLSLPLLAAGLVLGVLLGAAVLLARATRNRGERAAVRSGPGPV